MSRRVAMVAELFRLFEQDGVDAVLEQTPPDVVWAPLGAAGRGFVGREVREYFAAQQHQGAHQTHRMFGLEEHGEAVIVRGSVQIHSREAHHDFQPTWVYRFEGETLRSATGYPTYRDALVAVQERRS